MPTISVIVPVYNVEPYLRRCVDSILSQTYTDFELILVDDGSPDNCPAICDEYAVQDSRVRVIHKMNGGLSDARNAGLRVADGKYISFIDSDDLIREDMYEVLLAELVRTDADFIKSNFQVFSRDTELVHIRTPYTVSVFSPLEAAADFMETVYSERKAMKSTVCDTLYKRELFLEDGHLVLPFPVGKINEDTYIFPELLFRAKRIAHISEAFYYYYVREGGITHSAVSIREINSCDLWEYVYGVIDRHTDVYRSQIAENSVSRYLNTLSRIYHSDFRKRHFGKVRNELFADKQNLLQYVDDPRILRSLKLIKIYPLFLLLKRVLGNRIY